MVVVVGAHRQLCDGVVVVVELGAQRLVVVVALASPQQQAPVVEQLGLRLDRCDLVG